MLDHLPYDQREVVISLPYRVGVLVSMSDRSGGKRAQEQEMEALGNILDGFTQQVFGSELLQYVMQGTMDARDRWPEWQKNLNNVLKECRGATEILMGMTEHKEVDAYRLRLMEIAEAVAVAFREEENLSLSEKIKVYMQYWMTKRKAAKMQQSYKTFEEYLNISTKERAVLQRLARALGTTYL